MCTNWCSVSTGIPNVKCTKMQQMYQNSLGMKPSVLNTDLILSVPNATGVPNGFSSSCTKLPNFYHTMLCISAAYAVMRCLSVCVCLSVCLSVTFVDCVKTNVSSNFFHHRVDTPFQFFQTKQHGNILTGTPVTGALNAGRVGRNRDSKPIYGFTAF